MSVTALTPSTATSASSAAAQAAAFRANPNSIAATISDNTAFAVMGKYSVRPVTFYGGYERITYMNPKHSVGAGNTDAGGYVMSVISNTSYTTAKQFHVIWAGAKVAVSDSVDVIGGYYRYIQENYSGMDNSVCTAQGLSSCYGILQAASISTDYRLTKRLDMYAGVMYSRIDQGYYVGNGYLHNNTLSPMIGGRLRF